MERAERRGERGFALIAVLFSMAMLMAIGSAIHNTVVGETYLHGSHVRATSGFYAAEAGINRGMGDYRNIFMQFGVPSGSDFDLHTLSIGPRTVSYQLTNDPVNPYDEVVPVGRPFAGLHSILYKYVANSESEIHDGDTEVRLGTNFEVRTIPLFQFLAFYSNDLEINPGPAMSLHGPIHTNGSLYLSPGATLTVTDCTAAACPPLGINSVHVTAASNIYRDRKDAAGACTGTATISKLEDANSDGVLDTANLNCSGSKTDAQLSPWQGSIKARQAAVEVPSPDVLARGTGTFWYSADLRIALDVSAGEAGGPFPIMVLAADGTVDVLQNARLQNFIVNNPGKIFYNDIPNATVRAGTNQSCNLNADSPCNPVAYATPFTIVDDDVDANASINLIDLYPCWRSDIAATDAWAPVACTNNRHVKNRLAADGTVTARKAGFYNNREGRWTYMLNLNLHDFLARQRALQGSGLELFDINDTTDGGLVIFLTVLGPNTDTYPANWRYATRVVGSRDFDFPSGMADPTGVTIVTDQALFVEGNYNTGDVAATRPKMPAALVADTINVLSASWRADAGAAVCRNDCQSRRTLANRPTSSTRINAAFLAGVDTTAVGNYNGGLENYPRFHETWTGNTLTYRGSFVSLGTPQHANGAWCGTGATCNIYNPPIRAWDYDTEFQDAAKLPPATPRFVAVDQVLFTENFR